VGRGRKFATDRHVRLAVSALRVVSRTKSQPSRCLRTWRVILVRSRGQLLGYVEAYQEGRDTSGEVVQSRPGTPQTTAAVRTGLAE
jgi:hypothetical protein